MRSSCFRFNCASAAAVQEIVLKIIVVWIALLIIAILQFFTWFTLFNIACLSQIAKVFPDLRLHHAKIGSLLLICFGLELFFDGTFSIQASILIWQILHQVDLFLADGLIVALFSLI